MRKCLSVLKYVCQGFFSAIAILGVIALPVALAAQTPPATPEDMGLKPFGAYHGGNFDTVSMSNGNLFVKIPLFSIPQRGSVPLSYSLVYNTRHSKTYKSSCMKELTDQGTEDACTTQIRWAGSTPFVSGGADAGTPGGVVLRQETIFGAAQGPFEARTWDACYPFPVGPPGAPNMYCIANSIGYTYRVFIDSTGASHMGGEIARGIWRSLDGSNFYYEESTGVSKNADGLFNNGTADASGCTYDPNGNCVASTVDTLNRPIPNQVRAQTTADCPSGPRQVAMEGTLDVPGLNSSNLHYIFCYVNVTVVDSVVFSTTADPVTTTDSSGYFLQSVKLPDSTAWQFEYYDTTGDLKKMTLPLGGSISYETTQTTIDEGDVRATPGGASSVLSRTLDANDGSAPSVTHYSYAPGGNSMDTTVTDAAGNDTLTHLDCFVGGPTCSLYPTSVSSYSGSGSSRSLLRTVTTEYQYTPALVSQGGDVFAAYPTSVTTTLDNGLVS